MTMSIILEQARSYCYFVVAMQESLLSLKVPSVLIRQQMRCYFGKGTVSTIFETRTYFSFSLLLIHGILQLYNFGRARKTWPAFASAFMSPTRRHPILRLPSLPRRHFRIRKYTTKSTQRHLLSVNSKSTLVLSDR